MTPQKDKLSSLLLLLGSMAIFGAIGLVRRLIPLPSSVIAMARGLIGGGALLLLLAAKKERLGLRSLGRDGLWLLLSGALLGFNWILLFEAFRFTSVAIATLCYYISPVLVLIGAAVYLKEALSKRQLVCILIAFIGMAFVSGVVDNGLPALSESRGVLLAFLGAAAYVLLCWGFLYFLYRRKIFFKV